VTIAERALRDSGAAGRAIATDRHRARRVGQRGHPVHRTVGCIELGNALREALTDEGREVLAVLRELTDLLRPHHEMIRAAQAMCIAADDLQARARYARAP
jgi:hypothetical protein